MFESFIVIEANLGIFVELCQIGNVRRILTEIRILIFEMRDQHAELSSPITDVIQTYDFVTTKLQDTRYGITNHTGTKMTDMHVLCDVRRGVIDGDFLLWYLCLVTEFE